MGSTLYLLLCLFTIALVVKGTRNIYRGPESPVPHQDSQRNYTSVSKGARSSPPLRRGRLGPLLTALQKIQSRAVVTATAMSLLSNVRNLSPQL